MLRRALHWQSISSAEMGNNGIHEKVWLFISKLCVHEKWHQQFVKIFWIIMTGLSKMKNERMVGMIHAGTSKTDVKNKWKFDLSLTNIINSKN